MEYRNGEIIGYEITLYDVWESTSENITIYNESQFVFVKDNLKKYHNYSVQIAAKTSVGRGEYGSWIETKTLEDSKEKNFCVIVIVVVVIVIIVAAVVTVVLQNVVLTVIVVNLVVSAVVAVILVCFSCHGCC